MPERSSRRLALLRRELERVDGRPPDPVHPLPKHRKMAAGPFRFLRGAAQLYYADLKSGLLDLPAAFIAQPLHCLVMGDCHLANFGFMTEEGSHSRKVIFAPNDFDDACAGPAAWDLARFATSLFVAARQARCAADPDSCTAPGEDDTAAAAAAFLDAYGTALQAVAGKPERRLDAVRRFPKGHPLRKPFKKARRRAAGGRDFATKSSLGKAAEIGPQGLRFRDRPGRYRRLGAAAKAQLRAVLRPYVDDDILDLVARLDAGTGSIGMDRYYLLVGPADFTGPADLPLCHVVEVKQQRPAAPLHHFPGLAPANTLSPAHLTVDCQRQMQRRPDLVLDELVWQDAHWLVRSRHHARVSLDPEALCIAPRGEVPAARLMAYAQACGTALALAHSRGDRRSTRFEAAMLETLREQGGALIAAAGTYARQTAEDCLSLRRMLSGD